MTGLNLYQGRACVKEKCVVNKISTTNPYCSRRKTCQVLLFVAVVILPQWPAKVAMPWPLNQKPGQRQPGQLVTQTNG